MRDRSKVGSFLREKRPNVLVGLFYSKNLKGHVDYSAKRKEPCGILECSFLFILNDF